MRLIERATLIAMLILAGQFFGLSATAGERIEVWRQPGCGCCLKWVDHLRAAGFEVVVDEARSMSAVTLRKSVPEPLRSCHTAKVAGYLVEGHVPAQDIARLLAERPPVAGLAVPGMPIGSPGMEVPGQSAEPYDVIAFGADGQTTVYSSHTGQ
ncbi:MAG: DUF411 domain-containing protein [Rhizobiales bacterium]|nr:DUF411 domain-containing protein [Hyphomicrobiales bacterium]